MEEKIIQAKTLAEAITNACVELGVPSDELEYTIRQTGSNGFFGLGAKPYVISVHVKSAEMKDKTAGAVTQAAVETAPEDIRKEEKEKREFRKEKAAKNSSEEKDSLTVDRPEETKQQKAGAETLQTRGEKKPNRSERGERRQDRRERADRAEGGRDRKERAERPEKAKDGRKEFTRAAGNPEGGSIEKRPDERRERRNDRPVEDPTPRAEAFLKSLFQSMEMQINCKASFDPENNELAVDLSGEDMGVLIGKRGQTLDALQYLTSQVINKHLNGYVRVKLDTENYRERRKETLETLAENIAHKVRRTHRPVALEPMNPYERRIIHSILQNEKDVMTRSEGEEPYRHVVVVPTRKNQRRQDRNERNDRNDRTERFEKTDRQDRLGKAAGNHRQDRAESAEIPAVEILQDSVEIRETVFLAEDKVIEEYTENAVLVKEEITEEKLEETAAFEETVSEAEASASEASVESSGMMEEAEG